MKLEFYLYRGKILLQEDIEECLNYKLTFRERLASCLSSFCQKYDVDTPIWMSTNTREFAAFHMTTFSSEHFMKQPYFDSLVMKFVED